MKVIEMAARLNLKKPYKIILKSSESNTADAKYWGMYNSKGKLESHLIHVYLGNDSARSLETLIAHELCHAKQDERGNKDTHGKSFRRYAARFPEYPMLYMPDIDI